LPALDFTKYAIPLKFPFQNSEGLVDIVVANKNFQSKLLSQGETLVRVARN